jgi:DNA-binding transcriptional ArsR family regulator
MARQSVSKHLSVLEAANLVTVVWRGREKLHQAVQLTVIHDDFEPGSHMYEAISGRLHGSAGWPELIASLKTLLETGEPLREVAASA